MRCKESGAWNWMTHRTVLSNDPDKMVLPSGLMATLETMSECPSSLHFSWPVAMSHTLVRVGVIKFKM